MPNAGPPQQIPVGSLYGLPGFTETFEQYENINNWSTTLVAGSTVPFNPPSSFQKTDIVKWWEMETFWTYSYAVGTSALFQWSPWAPWNFIQSFKLKLQGQYTPVEVESGVDMAFFQAYRPMRGKSQRNTQDMINQFTANQPPYLLGTTTTTPPGINPNALSTGLTPFLPPVSGQVPSTQFAAGVLNTATIPMLIEIPAGLWLDQYWDLAVDGSLLPNASGVVQPVSAFVSPQYMGGGERVIVPQFNFAPIVSANLDLGPAAFVSGTQGANTGSTIVNCRRVGVYSSENPAELPPVYNWQYRRSSKRYPIGAVSKVDIPVTEYGQLFSVWVRIFDPAAPNFTTNGNAYNITAQTSGVGQGNQTNQGQNVTKCQLLYGSNLPKFDDDIPTMQARFIQQHGMQPWNGFIVWDMLASGQDDLLTNNSRILNTLTNANTHVHLEFASGNVPSSSAYAVIGTELLVPVSTQ
jgi:hypothetical protein